jgi:hypothetical protein
MVHHGSRQPVADYIQLDAISAHPDVITPACQQLVLVKGETLWQGGSAPESQQYTGLPWKDWFGLMMGILRCKESLFFGTVSVDLNCHQVMEVKLK